MRSDSPPVLIGVVRDGDRDIPFWDDDAILARREILTSWDFLLGMGGGVLVSHRGHPVLDSGGFRKRRVVSGLPRRKNRFDHTLDDMIAFLPDPG
jgi:hypothetical protein